MRWTRMLGLWAGCGLLAGCASLPSGPATRSVSKTERREATLACARLCERHNDAGQARRIYQALIKENPKQVEPYHRLAVLAAKEGNFAEAEAYFQKALAAGPATAELLSDMGYALYLQDRLPEAEKALRRAVEVDPNYLAAHNNLGLVLGQQGKFDAAMASFRKAGSAAQAHANMGYVYATRGELDQAEREYSRALTLDQELRPAAEALIQVARYTGSIGRPKNVTPHRDTTENPDDDVALGPSKPASRPRSAPTGNLAAGRKPTANHPRKAATDMPNVAHRPTGKNAMPGGTPASAEADVPSLTHVSVTPPKHREPFSWRSQPSATQDEAGTLVLKPNLMPESTIDRPSAPAAAKRPAPDQAAEPTQPQLTQRQAPRKPVVKIVAHEAADSTSAAGSDARPVQASDSHHAAEADAASAVWVSDDADQPAAPARQPTSATRQRRSGQAARPQPPRRSMFGRLLLGDEPESQGGFATASDAPQSR